MVYVPGDRIVFKKKEKKVETQESAGGHILVNLELVGKWEDSEAILLVEKEEDTKNDSVIKMIHKNFNHKSKEQMIYAYINAGKLDKGLRKKIISMCWVKLKAYLVANILFFRDSSGHIGFLSPCF